jgi:hypothetical protein
VNADFERFEELVVCDDELTETLWAEMDASAFVETVVRLAAERSLRISADDVRRVLHHGRERWWKRYGE